MKARLQWIALALLALVMAAFGFVLWTKVLFPPPQIVFIDAGLEPSEVRPGQHLIVRALADVRSPPDCFQGTQRVVHFAGGSETRLPGTRVSRGSGHRQTITYDMTIPDNAPAGEATVRVRELFTCGGGDPVNSPVLRFWVVR